MKSRKLFGRPSGRVCKDETQSKNVRHSSPVLDPCESGEISSKLERSIIFNVNRSSNGSEVSVPGHSLHRDSGISSFDSLAGGEKRSISPAEQDFVTELLKIADVKLAELTTLGNSPYDGEGNVVQTSKQMLPASSLRRKHVVLPVARTGNTVSDVETSLAPSVFVTAMDADVQMNSNEDQLSDDHGIDMRYKLSQNDTVLGDAMLHCSSCGNIFISPRLLPCLHTFCTECLQTKVFTQKPETSAHSDERAHISNYECSSQWLTCPACSVKVNLSLEGVHALPVNHMIERHIMLYNLRLDDGNKLTSCDLCPDNSNIEARCLECKVDMCQFCFQAHKRQSLTAAHTVICTGEAEGCKAELLSHKSRKLNVPVMCQRHTDEELRLYCMDCSQLVCRDCCLGSKHRDHKCEYLDCVIKQKVLEMSNESKSCKAKIKSLQKAILSLQQSEKVVDDITNEVVGKVERHIESYIRALERHKNTLLSSVQAKAGMKREALQIQKDNLSKALKDLSHSCEFTTQLLNLGNSHEILTIKPLVLQRLKNLSQIRIDENPISVDNFMEFKANRKVSTWIDGDVVVGVASNKRSSKLLRPGLEVDICGDVVSHAVEPKNCTAHGEGIHCSKVKLPSEFIIAAKNFEGEKLEVGGHDVTVSLTMAGVDPNLFKKPKVQISDRQDGTYRVLYIVHAAGNYNLVVRIAGEDIYGSSFRVAAVDPKSHIHSGIFHCCSFCSSGGDRNSTCACGSVMPGGYKGCGHGHRGHPGTAHWSCCGKSTETSSCGNHYAAPPPNIARLSPNPHGVMRSLTLPTHRKVATNVLRHASAGGSDVYTAPGALRSQRETFQPTQYHDRQQSVFHSPLYKQVKTVTL